MNIGAAAYLLHFNKCYVAAAHFLSLKESDSKLGSKGLGMGLMQRLLIWGIRAYQTFISPLFPPACRFQPTCSQYALEAVRRFGPGRGSRLALRRILSCHPFHPGGYDPVPADEYTAPARTDITAPVEREVK